MDTASLILGTYVITKVITESDGAWGILYKLRSVKTIQKFGLLECFLCTSFWIALVLCYAFSSIHSIFIAWGAAFIIDQLIERYRL